MLLKQVEYYLTRPDITIFHKDGTIGVIKEPKSIWNILYKIYDGNSDPKSDDYKYRVVASCFQYGVGWRGSIFGKCYETRFPIFHKNNDKSDIGFRDGLITKKFSACAKDDNLKYPEALEIIFPNDATPEDKFLLICVALTIDYRFYEINPNEIQSEAKL